MKLNFAERILVNNPLRALVQRHYEVPLLMRLGGRVDGCSVLEIGCGSGAGMELLLDEFAVGHATGVDLDPEQVKRAARLLNGRAPDCFSLEVADVETLPFPDESFDAIFDFGMLHHVPRWQAAVCEITRVLKPGGRFFFEEITREALQRWLYRTLFDHPSENRFGRLDFAANLRQHGFTLQAEPQPILFGDGFAGVAIRQ